MSTNEYIYFKRHGILEQEDFKTVLRAAGETVTTQENIQDWLELDDREPGFHLLTEKEIAAVIFCYLLSLALSILLHFPFICFLSFFFCSSVLYFASLIRIMA
jgi:hypothetical protein